MSKKPTYEELEKRIKELETVEKSLQESERRLRISTESGGIGLWELDLINLTAWRSLTHDQIFGYKKLLPEWSYETFLDHVVKEDRPLVEKKFGNALKNIDFWDFQCKIKRIDGVIRQIHAKGKPELDKNQNAIKMYGTVQDITDLKLVQREAMVLKTAIDQAPVGIALADENIQIYYCNPEGLGIRGGNIGDLVEIPKDVFDNWQVYQTNGEAYEIDNLPLVRAIKKGETIREEFIVKNQDGTDHTCDAFACPVFENGKIIGGMVVFLDITERKQNEKDREKLQAQLSQVQKMESVGRLAGGVAHDFNNMLGVILGHTELALLQADENHDLYDDLKEIQKAAKRSADITKQLLAFARKDIISPKKLDFNDTVESMLSMLRRLIGEDIDLVWKPSANLWPIKMDPSQIDQILANLCVNARDAISGIGKLTIETGRKSFDEEYCKEHAGFIPGDFILLAFSDNGCGMDKDTLDNMFEPFFTTKEVGKGTGLGLATIYGIIKQNKGFINVYSEPGRGSTFKIYLPRSSTDKNSDKDLPEKKAAIGGTETILLVEDEPTILRMTRMMLERKGYSVLSAATPVKAVDLAKTHADKIHLLMTDVVMPEMNGRDLAERIIGLYPDIRLLFMSGYTADVIAHQGVLDDGVAFIQKPFSLADMTEKVRDVLDMALDKNQG